MGTRLFKQRIKICRVCKFRKRIVETTKIEESIHVKELIHLSEASANKICPLVRYLLISEKASTEDQSVLGEIQQSILFPKFTCVQRLILKDFSSFFNNLVPISKLICASQKTLFAICVYNVEPFESLLSGTTFPNMTLLILHTQEPNFDFKKAFFEHIPKMFPNLGSVTFRLQRRRNLHPIIINGVTQTHASRQDYVNFVDWVRNLKFSQLPNLYISAQFEDVRY
jgi:hypothetical protein